MNYVQTLTAIQALPMAARRTDGEWRVAPPLSECFAHGDTVEEAKTRQEQAAYYTDDAADALATARAMRDALDA